MKTIEDVLRERRGDPEARAAHASRMRAEARSHRLLELREAYGMSVSELAGASGTHPDDVVEIERGQVDHRPVTSCGATPRLSAPLFAWKRSRDVRHRIA